MSTKRSADRKTPAVWTTATICRRLEKAYGPVAARPKQPVLDELIAVILSQHTSDRNSQAAFAELKRRFPDWDSVRRASKPRIVSAIRSAGLSRQKAPRIKAILKEIHEARGALDLEFVRELPVEQAIDYLSVFPGVGPKTVACVLLFSCGMPVLPVDTHVHRVSQRLGLIETTTSAEAAHVELARQVPAQRVLDFHVQLIRHGRRVCRARGPACEQCVLRARCPGQPAK